MKTAFHSMMLLCWLLPAVLSAQTSGLKLKLQLLPDGNTWGVYVKPVGISPTTNQTITVGGSQVTVVMPITYAWGMPQSINGIWSQGGQVNGPAENPSKTYVSFWFVNEITPIPYQENVETLLFTFKGYGNCPDSLYLIDNFNDPFNQLPNSIQNNPGNELMVFDPFQVQLYDYVGNYAHAAWSCQDNDNDGILNAYEDTNGNGYYNAGIDATDLNAFNTCDFVSIANQPRDTSICAGSEVHFVAGFANTGANNSPNGSQIPTNYIWQKSPDGGATWHNITTASGNYSGISGSNIGASGTDTLTITNAVGLNGCMFRIAYYSPICSAPVYSNSATLNFTSSVTFTNDPDDITVCAGSDTVFVATAAITTGTFSFGWEISDDNGLTWSDINFPSPLYSHTITGDVTYGTDVLTVTNVAGMYGRRFRAVAYSTDCVNVYSNYAILSVQGPLSVLDQPDDVVECSGNATTFCAKIANPGVVGSTIVRWQISLDNGITWVPLQAAGAIYNGGGSINHTTGITCLSINNVAGLHNALYRVSYRTSTCAIQYTNAARLTVEGPITITEQPESITLVCTGSDVTLTGAAAITSGNLGDLEYQWQISSDNGNNYVDAGPNMLSGMTGWDSPILTIENATGFANKTFRLAVSTNECNRVYSTPAKLVVQEPLIISSQPVDFTNCADEEAYFYVNAYELSGYEVFSQWQMSADGGTSWQDITELADTINGNIHYFGGYDGDSLLISPINGMNGYQFRAKLWNSGCGEQISNTATLHVEGDIYFTDQPDDLTLCSEGPACFSIAVENESGVGNIQYQWQRWTVGGWVNMNNSPLFSGVFSNQLCISNVAWLYNAKFQCRVKTGSCEAKYSELANLFVEGPITINLQPTHATVCSNKGHAFNTTIVNLGTGTMTYRWQYSQDGGSTWTNFPTNIGSFSTLGVVNPTYPTATANWQGGTGQDLNITNVNGLDGWMFRLEVKTPTCAITTDEVTLTVPVACLDGSCDLDNDGIANELDADGYDCGSACVKIKLQLLPDSSGWAVMAKPFGNYSPTGNQWVEDGQITIVTPTNFEFGGFATGSSVWAPSAVLANMPNNPNRKYISFDLTESGQTLNLVAGQETMLFQFDKLGDCPDSLYILENAPSGMSANYLYGSDLGFAQGFELCGVYARKAWRCKKSGGSIPPTVVTEDSFKAPMPGAATDAREDADIAEGPAAEGHWFTASPNPASDHVNIVLSEKLAAEGSARTSLALWDMQGKKRLENKVESTTTLLDLSGLPAGVYFVALAQNGRVVERTKIVKH